jgi:AraC-like DNA-binding protein
MGTLRVLPTRQLLGVQALKFEGASQVYSHYNDVFSIATLFRSQSLIGFRGKAHQAMDGAVGLLEPDGIFRHLRIPVAESVGKLHIDASVMDDARRSLGARSGAIRVRSVITRSPELFRALSRFHAALERETSGLERQELFARVLERVFADGVDGSVAPQVSGRETAAIRRVRDILHARFAEQVSLQELADAAGLSQFYLLRVFGRSLGVPPHQYQTHLRLARARALLRLGEPASQVATAVGFADQSHFVRAFRRLHGLTPGMFFAHAKDALTTTQSGEAVL